MLEVVLLMTVGGVARWPFNRFFMQHRFQPPTGLSDSPNVVKNLLIINIFFFVIRAIVLARTGDDLNDVLGLHLLQAPDFQPYQLVTHMFMHGSFMHLFFNMWALWMFGSILERSWGSRRFFVFYLITGLGAALLYSLTSFLTLQSELAPISQFLTDPTYQNLLSATSEHKFMIDFYQSPSIAKAYETFETNFRLLQSDPNNVSLINQSAAFLSDYRDYYFNLPIAVGASGAIYGLLLAYGVFFPDHLLLLFFFFPVKAKYAVILLGALELFLGTTNVTSNVAHFAHLGGMLFGWLLIKLWRLDSFFKP